MTTDDLNKAIRDVIKALLVLPDNFVRKSQVTAAPSGSVSEAYATVLVMNLLPETQWAGNVETPDADVPLNVLVHTRQQFTAQVSVQFFRAGAFTYAARLATLLQTPQAAVLMQARNIGLARVGSPKNLSATVNTLWEDRGQLDLGINMTVEEDVSVPTFGTFPIGFKTDNSPTQTFEVTAP